MTRRQDDRVERVAGAILSAQRLATEGKRRGGRTRARQRWNGRQRSGDTVAIFEENAVPRAEAVVRERLLAGARAGDPAAAAELERRYRLRVMLPPAGV